MKTSSKRNAVILVIAMGVVMGGVSVPAVAAPFLQNQAPDYSKNKTYQQGMREGKDDQTHNKDHSKKRHFKKDTDQQAYEAGYQKGH
jgi:hypothetical protein